MFVCVGTGIFSSLIITLRFANNGPTMGLIPIIELTSVLLLERPEGKMPLFNDLQRWEDVGLNLLGATLHEKKSLLDCKTHRKKRKGH